MAALSDSAEKLALDFLMTTGTATRPTAWYVALYTAAPNDASTGSTGGTEVSGNGYSRQAVTFAAGTSPGGTTTSTNAQSFTASGGNFGAVTHMSIIDASSGGNMIWHGALTTSRTVNDGDTLTFSTGNIDLTLA
tara:strand:- start:157 stop:561 length:405 start_codon:yes stop_codon:yes gene_type:complete